jgi:hypothetical protein
MACGCAVARLGDLLGAVAKGSESADLLDAFLGGHVAALARRSRRSRSRLSEALLRLRPLAMLAVGGGEREGAGVDLGEELRGVGVTLVAAVAEILQPLPGGRGGAEPFGDGVRGPIR